MISLFSFLLFAFFATYSNISAEKESFDKDQKTHTENKSITEDAQANLIAKLQNEIAKLSQQQSELSTQKNNIQEELYKTTNQLKKTREEQTRLSKDITELSSASEQLTKDNESLNKQLHYLKKDNARLETEAFRLESERKRIESNLASTEEELAIAHHREKELTRNKLVHETHAAQEVYRLQKNIMTLEEKMNDHSWSDAFDKHTIKMFICFAGGGLTTYLITYYCTPETA